MRWEQFSSQTVDLWRPEGYSENYARVGSCYMNGAVGDWREGYVWKVGDQTGKCLTLRAAKRNVERRLQA